MRRVLQAMILEVEYMLHCSDLPGDQVYFLNEELLQRMERGDAVASAMRESVRQSDFVILIKAKPDGIYPTVDSVGILWKSRHTWPTGTRIRLNDFVSNVSMSRSW